MYLENRIQKQIKKDIRGRMRGFKALASGKSGPGRKVREKKKNQELPAAATLRGGRYEIPAG